MPIAVEPGGGAVASLNASQLRALASSVGLSNSAANVAGAVAMGESSGNPQAQNGHYLGLWQIGDSSVHPQFAGQDLFDPQTNARAMAVLSNKGANWQPWEAFTNGAYKQYLYAGSGGFFGSITSLISNLPAAGAVVGGNVVSGIPGANAVAGGITGFVSNADQAAALGSKLLGNLTQGSFWKRVGVGAGGIALILLATITIVDGEKAKTVAGLLPSAGKPKAKETAGAAAQGAGSGAGSTAAEAAEVAA